ncbi:hypothetical protein VTJ83DRAFT_6619 [Remersonia thermophila]|uniref:Uncharacterized protein n=1 Tax=Remersonia thermophila TaxID=72144 RepID=A0ABR4D650_9PEZI
MGSRILEKAAAREAEKERSKQEKAQEKARAAALTEVNKLRTDKWVLTPEMIVNLPDSLPEDVRIQTETLLRDLEFVEIVVGGGQQQQQQTNLEAHALGMKRCFPGDTLMYLIEGLDNNTPANVDEEVIDQALLHLQAPHSFLIHHIRDAAADAAGVAFCMESGQVRTGDSPKDTYVRVLQEIGRVTAPVAYLVVG